MHSLSQIAANLRDIRDLWGDLLVALEPGTALPWSELPLTDEQRTTLDALAKAERAERQVARKRIGLQWMAATPIDAKASESPLRDATLDVIVDVTARIAELEDAVRTQLGVPARCDRCTHELDEHSNVCDLCMCHGYIRRISGTNMHWSAVWIEDRCTDRAQDLSDELVEVLLTETTQMASAVRHAIGLSEPRTHLKAPCFVCGGWLLFAFNSRGFVACMNPGCEPSEAQSGKSWKGHPIWPEGEWDWLAQQITAAQAGIPGQRKTVENKEKVA